MVVDVDVDDIRRASTTTTTTTCKRGFALNRNKE